MKTVILCGGMGTRLREETEYRPKPMVDVGGYPIVWHIMKLYAHYQITEFVLCLGYRGNMIKEYFLNYEAMNNDFTISLGDKQRLMYHGHHREQDFTITLADTGADTMTGARIKRIERYIDGDEFMVTYGDGLSDVPIDQLLAFHRAHGRLATMTIVRPISRFGVIQMDDTQQVTSFMEKPAMDGWVNAGYFIFNRRIFDYIDSDDPECILEREPLERLSSDGQLMAYQHEGFFYAMDTYREYLYLNELWKQGDAPWAVWNRQ